MSGLDRTETPLATVFAEGRCAGFVLYRGRQGFEAFDINQRSVGIYASQHRAISALRQQAVETLPDGDS
jgi:hypothetical protein